MIATAELVDAHLHDLEASGLTADTIITSGIYSAPAAEVEALLGYGAGSGMVIPYEWDEHGQPAYARVKLDHAGTDGKRYRSPRGRGNRLYIPRTLDAHALGNVAVPLVITEGEKKCLAANQAGLLCVAVPGVWSWKTRNGGPERAPIDDLNCLLWRDRCVLVVFDSDAASNLNVRAAEEALARELTARGARVIIKRLPSGPDGQKWGLDDFLIARGVAAFHAVPDVAAAATSGATPRLIIIGAGTFLGQSFPDAEPLIEDILSDDGGGWLGGEEKLGKTWWMEAEALSLALALKLADRFVVPQRRRVMILEEEDSPRRTNRRLAALVRGHRLDPDDQAFRDDLDTWLKLSIWGGFTLDNPKLVAELETAIREFRPAVVYIDCLRKVTLRNLNHADEASALLGILDDLRRRYNVIFRLVHHYRKQQGFRTARGS